MLISDTYRQIAMLIVIDETHTIVDWFVIILLVLVLLDRLHYHVYDFFLVLKLYYCISQI